MTFHYFPKYFDIYICTLNFLPFSDIKIWHIIAEIIRINVLPSPRNPFAIDYTYFDSLSNEDFILATGAMIHFLGKNSSIWRSQLSHER